MAKKTAKKPAAKPEAKADSPGKGKKACPNCGKIIGAAARKCAHCQTEFKGKPKSKKTRKAAADGSIVGNGFDSKVATIKKALGLIESLGGEKQAKEVLATLEKVSKI